MCARAAHRTWRVRHEPRRQNSRLFPQESTLHRTEPLRGTVAFFLRAKVHRLALPELPHRTVCWI